MRIAHISDTHFGAEDAAVSAALQRHLITEAPDLILLSGDITQRARAAQFVAARQFLDALAPIPFLSIPGNHDLPLFDLVTRFTSPYRHYQKTINAVLAPEWLSTDVAVISVNSTHMFRHKNGVLSPKTIYAIAQRLRALTQPFKVVTLHHPLAVVFERDKPDCVESAGEAVSTWAKAGADLFLSGHIHLPYCITAGPELQQAVVLQAGTAVSTRRRSGQANSFNMIRFEAGEHRTMYVEQRDYHTAQDAFITVKSTRANHGVLGWLLEPDSGLRAL